MRAGIAQPVLIGLQIGLAQPLQLGERHIHAFRCPQHPLETVRPQGEILGRAAALAVEPGRDIGHCLGGGRRCFLELGLLRGIANAGKRLARAAGVEFGKAAESVHPEVDEARRHRRFQVRADIGGGARHILEESDHRLHPHCLVGIGARDIDIGV